MNTSDLPVVHAPAEGERLWFLDTLLTVKTCASDGAPYAVCEQRLPAGSETPLHRHHREDESFYVLEGEVTFVVEGAPPRTVGPGTFVRCPAGRAHGYRAETPLRLLVLSDPTGFVSMAREAGTPAPQPVLPVAGPPDVPKLVGIAAQHGIDILGPLPG